MEMMYKVSHLVLLDISFLFLFQSGGFCSGGQARYKGLMGLGWLLWCRVYVERTAMDKYASKGERKRKRYWPPSILPSPGRGNLLLPNVKSNITIFAPWFYGGPIDPTPRQLETEDEEFKMSTWVWCHRSD